MAYNEIDLFLSCTVANYMYCKLVKSLISRIYHCVGFYIMHMIGVHSYFYTYVNDYIYILNFYVYIYCHL